VNNAFGLAFEVRLFPAIMQGTNVEASVLAALEAICDEPERWDCVVIIRGGGATSDLSDFDSYSLAAAVAQMPLPVVVGIGHERDETVLDFVAHTRVKTPTAAAAFLIDHGTEQLALLDELQQRIVRSTQLAVQSSLFKVQGVEPRITRAARLVIQSSMLKVQSIEPRFARAVRHILESSKLRAQSLGARVAALDPELQLRRGYSLTYTDDGRLVRSVADVHEGDTIKTRIADGDLLSVLKSADLFGKQ
jgi:exodeoxyribonuclease VII large subunit